MNWLNFRKASPVHYGYYTWKVRGKNDFDFIFVAYFGPKYMSNDQPYPYFVHWNGWYGELPQGSVFWRERLEGELEPDKKHNYDLLGVEKDGERIELTQCPFCKKTPKFMGVDGFIGAFPHQYWRWSVECCHVINWTSLIHQNPKSLADYWNGTLK